MAGNSFGQLFKITTFGESHGAALGVIIDGCPAGLSIDFDFIQQELNRRKPGQSSITTQRKEDESFEILSGVFDGVTTGTPICMMVKNNDQRSGDYSHLKEVYRPSHADYTYQQKYGLRDYRGGGRASARETVARVMAGAVATVLLKHYNSQIFAYVDQVGEIRLPLAPNEIDAALIETNLVRCPHEATAEKMITLINQTGEKGDSVGGAVTCTIQGVMPGLGEPVFDKLHAELGKAMLSINACKGFEIGSGFQAAQSFGSAHNDEFVIHEGNIHTRTNNSGGVQGGISNGEPIYFRCAFKPVATIRTEQNTVSTQGEETVLAASGRHDPCVVPRAVPIVEAMAALVIADFLLRNHSVKLF
ncbi:MAG: chorismate synthase [Bacteroidota bacterium]